MHAVVLERYFVDLYTWNLYCFVNWCHPNKLKKKHAYQRQVTNGGKLQAVLYEMVQSDIIQLHRLKIIGIYYKIYFCTVDILALFVEGKPQ